MPKYTISIADPCHEKWEEMTATGCGAFCSSCQKEVIDFTDKTSFEVADILNRNKGGTCGKLTRQQLDFVYEFVPDKPVKAMWFRRGVIGAALAFLVSVFQQKATAQTAMLNTVNVEKLDAIVPVTDEPVDTNKFIIKGVVVSETNDPLPFVIITVTGTTQTISTDIEGKFILNVDPSVLQGNQCKLTVSYLGFERKEVVVDRKDANAPVVIKLKEMEPVFMGIIIQIPPPGPSTPIEHEMWWGLKYGIWD